jgi:hypothetical protein
VHAESHIAASCRFSRVKRILPKRSRLSRISILRLARNEKNPRQRCAKRGSPHISGLINGCMTSYTSFSCCSPVARVARPRVAPRPPLQTGQYSTVRRQLTRHASATLQELLTTLNAVSVFVCNRVETLFKLLHACEKQSRQCDSIYTF